MKTKETTDEQYTMSPIKEGYPIHNSPSHIERLSYLENTKLGPGPSLNLYLRRMRVGSKVSIDRNKVT